MCAAVTCPRSPRTPSAMATIAASVAFSEAALDVKNLSANGNSRGMCGSNSNNYAITFGHIRFSRSCLRSVVTAAKPMPNPRPVTSAAGLYRTFYFRLLCLQARATLPPSHYERDNCNQENGGHDPLGPQAVDTPFLEDIGLDIAEKR